ncbi:MAG: tetratricopeptide repeat protein, partial [Cyanobacteria bacterium J06588_4]
YKSQGKYEVAEALYLKALEINKNLLGENHPHTQTMNSNLLDLCERLAQQQD